MTSSSYLIEFSSIHKASPGGDTWGGWKEYKCLEHSTTKYISLDLVDKDLVQEKIPGQVNI